jgi:hypothetical protein
MKGLSCVYTPVASIRLLAASVLFGCGPFYLDVNVDLTKNNKATFQSDAIDCAQSYPEPGSGMQVKQRIAYMNLKGCH